MEKCHFHQLVSKSFTRISRVEVQSEQLWVKDNGPNVPGQISYWSVKGLVKVDGLQKWMAPSSGNRTSARVNFGTGTSAQISKTFINFGTI